MRDVRRNKTKPQRISLQMAEQSRMKKRLRSLQMEKQSKQTLVTVRIYWILATIGYLLVLFLHFMIGNVDHYSLAPVFDFTIFAIIGIVGGESFYYWHKSAYECYKHYERHNKMH